MYACFVWVGVGVGVAVLAFAVLGAGHTSHEALEIAAWGRWIARETQRTLPVAREETTKSSSHILPSTPQEFSHAQFSPSSSFLAHSHGTLIQEGAHPLAGHHPPGGALELTRDGLPSLGPGRGLCAQLPALEVGCNRARTLVSRKR